MSILTRYIFKEMVGPTALGFGFYTSIIVMRQLFDMAGVIIRGSLPAAAVGKLMLFSLPNIIVLTVPMSLLFGILIAVGRLSSDSEIVAMRSLGMSTRKIYRPVLLLSVLIFLFNAFLMNVVLPVGNKQLASFRAELMASTAEKVVTPRVFHDQYENLILFVKDIDEATGQWKGVFVADSRTDETREPVTPTQMAGHIAGSESEEDIGALSQATAGQRIIVAKRGNLSVTKRSKEIWLNLFDAETHVWNPQKPDRYDRTQNASQRILLPTPGGYDSATRTLSVREMTLRELLDQEQSLSHSRMESDRVTRNSARVEIQKKFAIPFACIAFGVLGLPLGLTNRRGGKSSGFSLSILIILFYWVTLRDGEQLAVSGQLPPWIAMWAPNIILLTLGIYLLNRANRDFASQRSGGYLARMFRGIRDKIVRHAVARRQIEDQSSILNRLDITFPNIMDRYVLREFLKVLALVLISVVALFIIIDFTDLATDIRKNQIGASTVLAYYRFYLFNVLNWTLPISVLVSTLVTFAMLSKNNEITAVKANGVSLYRVAAPVVAIAVVIAILSYFLLDFVLPYSNQRVDELKRRVKGKPVVTATAQQKLWHLGSKGRYIINFLGYDRNAQRLTQVQVFEFHPTEFRLARRVYARRATWNGSAWVFEDGWIRSFPDNGNTTDTPITRPIALQYAETPEDFATEVKAPDQMTYAQLRRYIALLGDSGYATSELTVKLYEKMSWPAISCVMALIALPFAFRIGKRGALYGIGLALILGVVYWICYAVFTKFGEVGNLPPFLAAWAANVLFSLSAVYLFLRVET